MSSTPNGPRLAGGLFLSAFLLYGGGSALVGADRVAPGAVLMLLNSAAVLAIGLLLRQTLARTHPGAARVYLAARAWEAALLAAGVGLILADRARAADTAYWLAMLGLGVGSVWLCRALLATGSVPRWLAGWGLAGYALLALGAALELVGVDAGLALSAPGGLFEVAFGMVLLVRGLARPARGAPADPAGPPCAPPARPA